MTDFKFGSSFSSRVIPEQRLQCAAERQPHKGRTALLCRPVCASPPHLRVLACFKRNGDTLVLKELRMSSWMRPGSVLHQTEASFLNFWFISFTYRIFTWLSFLGLHTITLFPLKMSNFQTHQIVYIKYV